MPRKWKKVPPVERPCACGCGEIVKGNAKKRFVNGAHRMRALRVGPMQQPVVKS